MAIGEWYDQGPTRRELTHHAHQEWMLELKRTTQVGPFMAGQSSLYFSCSTPITATSFRPLPPQMKPRTNFFLLGIASHCNGLGQVIVSNRCSFPVYLQSVQLNETPPLRLLPGDCYNETYRYASAFNPATGALSSVGVSIKLTTNGAVSQSSDEAARNTAFDSSAVTQLEYTYEPVPFPWPDLYYDLSDINDNMPRQFCRYGIRIVPSNMECDTVACAADCSRACGAAYNDPDDIATHACYSTASLNLILCSDA